MVLLLVAAALLLLACAGPAAAAQDQPVVETTGDQQRFDPDLIQDVPDTAPVEEPSDEPIDAADAETTTEDELSNETIQRPGWGSAADQSQQAKRTEAREACNVDAQPPVSKMLGLPGSVGGGSGGPLGWLILAIAGGALAVAGIAYVLRHKRGGSTATRGSLEMVATVVGILGGIAGLAVQFVPGIGVHEARTPSAAMEVRDVNARITHGEYTHKTHGRMPPGDDGDEVGNVIWLEVRLEGYGDKRPMLQYASYDPDLGQALLPGTAAQVPVPRAGDDLETHFLPIWIGYPLSERFVAGFRLLDGDRVQAVAETGRMKASKYRYACD